MAALHRLTVVKVGGSLAERGDPRPLMAALADLAPRHPLLVVPGGSDFAETVRHAAARFALSEPRAHWMALLAMDQYGLLLAELGAGVPTPRLDDAVRTAREGRLAVLLPSNAVLRSPLPWTWQVTSDAIAAWLAEEVRATDLIILKDVDGMLDREGALRSRVDARDLEGVVDPSFSAWLPPGIRCRLINGLLPDRLVHLLETGETVGTEVRA
ncbi:MAG TPA: hypothetical protein VD902_21335 [Symbiobacteriaceae bacterium]|nr:hypothetical protein [Symbiobacteriaceae bacterium]